ncbi:methicillin resistance protein [Oleiphilus sp. HI0071]|uniref:GNAT family N-acetyltransferase n=2 Tax=Oleiphilus TaxID=141450 RepID=UPI0007C25B93|nr:MULTISPECIES: GNAT family N-acetyltransferase [unclassified Oleiphilus]KZY72175.1 methicillin resistance protein [Oleiphilus sp. HI0065]KZY78441.1 methicillin resistance protein [Oleiphilus sp. HI0071]KZY93151.1 methicillin resistance protein [Oleiphilus sp. HI0073]KZZ47940.1 methicillin resistance protein [Oleiphilus sp. HI0122]KZZ77936.1 methicillin resistance protein [Oleiphilus sp. HI0133]
MLSDTKQKYLNFNEKEDLPIFLQPFWLDATVGDAWDVALVEKGGQVVGAMPYTTTKRLNSLTYLGQPSLTQHLGPWIRPSTGKYAKQLAREKDVMQSLIQQLPAYDSFRQNWSYTNQNWLPFYWKGFEQTTGYTYVLESLDDLNSVFDGFQENIRREIRKAQGRVKITVKSDVPLEEFLALNQKTFARQDMQMANDRSFVNSLVEACMKKQGVKWFVAYDEQERPHAGVLIVWDKHSAYYLMGGGDPELRNSGATSLCMWEAIKFASTVTKRFDFEGSMIEPIERFFRGFGAMQKPYFQISHTPNRWLRLAKALKAAR